MAPELGIGTFRITQASGDMMWATSNGSTEERWAYQAPIAASTAVQVQSKASP